MERGKFSHPFQEVQLHLGCLSAMFYRCTQGHRQTRTQKNGRDQNRWKIAPHSKSRLERKRKTPNALEPVGNQRHVIPNPRKHVDRENFRSSPVACVLLGLASYVTKTPTCTWSWPKAFCCSVTLFLAQKEGFQSQPPPLQKTGLSPAFLPVSEVIATKCPLLPSTSRNRPMRLLENDS